jgi:hypothetical protein
MSDKFLELHRGGMEIDGLSGGLKGNAAVSRHVASENMLGRHSIHRSHPTVFFGHYLGRFDRWKEPSTSDDGKQVIVAQRLKISGLQQEKPRWRPVTRSLPRGYAGRLFSTLACPQDFSTVERNCCWKDGFEFFGYTSAWERGSLPGVGL